MESNEKTLKFGYVPNEVISLKQAVDDTLRTAYPDIITYPIEVKEIKRGLQDSSEIKICLTWELGNSTICHAEILKDWLWKIKEKGQMELLKMNLINHMGVIASMEF